MLRHALESLGSLSFRARSTSSKQIRKLSHGIGLADEDLEAERAEARKWLSKLKQDTIPTSVAQASFSCSSGPGGQKTNKTSSKATLTWSLGAIKPYVPKILHPELYKSKFYVKSSDSLQISSQSSRRQQENKDECQEKLYELLKVITRNSIPGETPKEQKQKIVRLQKQENTARLQLKKKHTAKKQARRGGDRDY